MGIKYALPSHGFEVDPTHVEGREMWLEYKTQTGEETRVVLTMTYWNGATELVRRGLDLHHGCITQHGGTLADWNAIIALAADPTNLDDIIELLTLTDYGARILWCAWRGTQGF